MTLAFDILTGMGLAAGAGIRPFLPALLAGALASANLGIDFSHTDYAFLERGWFLLLIFALLVIAVIAQRRLGAEALERGPAGAALAGVSLGLGALLFAGTLAHDGYVSWPGLIGGIACAAVTQTAARTLFRRVRARLDAQAGESLTVYGDGGSLAVAGLSIPAPPISAVVLAFCGWLLMRSRRRGGKKYAGLRILR